MPRIFKQEDIEYDELQSDLEPYNMNTHKRQFVYLHHNEKRTKMVAMSKRIVLFLMSLMLLSACKSNLEAYNAAYQKLKEREEAQMNARAKTTTSIKMDSLSKDSLLEYKSEVLTLILGNEKNLSDFNLVARTFINRTNARGFYEQMKFEKYPAVLVQNQDQLYRIIVASFSTLEKAESQKHVLKELFPDVLIVARSKSSQ
jgi:hypothetical protein